MKTKTQTAILRCAALLLLALSTLILQPSTCLAQGTAFTYQGRLNDGGNAANGPYDLRFTIYDALTAGNAVSGVLPADDLPITNGLFTVTLDPGAGVFTGPARWLEIGVRPGASTDAYTNVVPRQPITATPYAIYAGKAMMLDGALPANQLTGTYSNALTLDNPANIFTGTFTGNGAGLSNLNAGTLGGLNSSNFWRTTGNAGTTAGTHFLGTTDDQPLEIMVNGQRALRLEPGTNGAPNFIGGAPINHVAPGVVGATIAGGGATNNGGFPYPNSIQSDFGVIGGGGLNNIGTNSGFSVVGGGEYNRIADYSGAATIAGGVQDYIGTNSTCSTIGGGGANAILDNSPFATIAGGGVNSIAASSPYATIAGGHRNSISTNTEYCAIGGGLENRIQNVRVNPDNANVIAGGYGNRIVADYATIGGGLSNLVTGDYATLGGGISNSASGDYSVVPGGRDNHAGAYAFAAGRRAKANHTGAFVWADSQNADFASTANNQFLIRADGGVGIGLNAPDAPLHVTGGSDVSLSGGGNIISGSINGANLALDGNEIMARNNGAASTLFLNVEGGNVSMCANGGLVSINASTLDSPLRVFAARCDGATWIDASDRNLKSGFAAVDARTVLEKVVRLPVTRWHYKTHAETEHLGPVAQDFHAAFGLGSDDVSIASVDAHGVALAAIQGLNQKTEDRSQRSEVRIQKLEAENAELKQALGALKQLVDSLAGKLNGGVK